PPLVRAGVVRPRVVARTIGIAAMLVDAAIIPGVVAFDGRVAMAPDRLGAPVVGRASRALLRQRGPTGRRGEAGDDQRTSIHGSTPRLTGAELCAAVWPALRPLW